MRRVLLVVSQRGCVADSFPELGRIDVIVSNTGDGLFDGAEELTDAQVDRKAPSLHFAGGSPDSRRKQSSPPPAISARRVRYTLFFLDLARARG
jgi:hypothetical protein